ncbi:MAG: methyltransferase [Halioglobus sp.]|nr:methyltransferase [Halioglobus sp.]
MPQSSCQNTARQRLEKALGVIIPGGELTFQRLPDCPALELLLLDAHYPQQGLTAEDVQRVMDNPLYWVFCWASGQVLARRLLDNPAWVAGRRVLDFGAGSGVAGIAAKLAGAKDVIACDQDPMALESCAVNARRNGVEIALADDFDQVSGAVDLIVVADVLYDRGNFPWLERFVERSPRVLIADSRVRDFDYPPYRQVATQDSCTLPDLDESQEFRHVKLYLAGTL